MVAVRISPFGGMVPAVDDRLLADINGSLSEDTWLYAGTALGLPQPKLLYTLVNPDAGKVYRLPNNYTDSLHLSDSVWMEFASTDTDVIRTQVVDDTFDRYYWASPLDVPRYLPLANIKIQAPALAAAYELGIPEPGVITATVTGGVSTTLVSVAYVQTWLSAYAEEGPPSPPVLIASMKADATVTVHLAPPDPADLGTNRNLTQTRIYRTITGTDGTTTFFLVATQAIGLTTYVDNHATATDAVIANNAELESTTWTGPPSDLQGLVTLSNGMVIGFRQNELWFCEPFRLHAWPAQYTLVTEYPIVGLGVADAQDLIVCTDGYAYICNGINPSSMSLTKLPGLLPCTSRGSILSTIDGVYYSSPAGLVLANSGGIVVSTKELIRKDKWNAMVATNTLRSARLGDAYYAFGQARVGVFDVASFDNNAFTQEDFSGARQGILIDPTSTAVAFNTLSSVDPITNIQTDAWSSEVFIIRDGQVQWLDIGDQTQVRMPYTWLSKIFQPAQKKNLQAMKVYFNSSPTWPITYVQDPSVPAMAGAQTGAVVMSADSFSIAGHEAWRASTEVLGDCWLSATSALPHQVTVDLGVSKTISSYQVGGPPPASPIGAAPKTWTLSGSNDSVNYTLVDTQTNAPAFIANELRTYTVGTPLSFRYWKISISVVQSGTQACLAQYQLFAPILGRITVFADGRQIMKRNLVTSGEQWRMPSGFKADFWQFQIDSALEIYSIQAATSAVELATV
jgi:hypothetical protein